MQVIRHGSRFARAASMSIKAAAAEGGPVAAARRKALGQWHAARREGPAAGKAADIVGVPRATLFSWDKLRRENRLEPRSRRPRCLRRADWPKSLVRTVREIRQDQPMWGKAKIAAAIRREWGGRKAPSESTVGRIFAHLVRAGDIAPVPALRGKAPRAVRSRMLDAGPKSAGRRQGVLGYLPPGRNEGSKSMPIHIA